MLVPPSSGTPKIAFPIAESSAWQITINSAKYQYSLLRARPLKVAYFLKQVVTASIKEGFGTIVKLFRNNQNLSRQKSRKYRNRNQELSRKNLLSLHHLSRCYQINLNRLCSGTESPGVQGVLPERAPAYAVQERRSWCRISRLHQFLFHNSHILP